MPPLAENYSVSLNFMFIYTWFTVAKCWDIQRYIFSCNRDELSAHAGPTLRTTLFFCLVFILDLISLFPYLARMLCFNATVCIFNAIVMYLNYAGLHSRCTDASICCTLADSRNDNGIQIASKWSSFTQITMWRLIIWI